MDRFDSLTRLIKLAAGEMADPGLQAMADAGDIAKGPAGMPGIKMHPEKVDGKDESKEVMRVAHELDAKSKEIAGLRQQLQEAKMDAQRVQVKAEITNEQTKMREGLRQEQQRMLDGIRKEQERMYAQIRAEQKELDKKQSELRIAEAQQKGEITAAKAEYEAGHTAAQAQYEAQFTAAEAQNRANMAIAQAQHQAQLDKDVSAHDAQIAQSKADSLMDIAQQTTDMYIKQTEKARADADKYFTTQQQQYSASHPVISPALQNRLDGAMKSIGRVGKSLNTMAGMGKLARAMRDLEKVAYSSTYIDPKWVKAVTQKKTPSVNEEEYVDPYAYNPKLWNQGVELLRQYEGINPDGVRRWIEANRGQGEFMGRSDEDLRRYYAYTHLFTPEDKQKLLYHTMAKKEIAGLIPEINPPDFNAPYYGDMSLDSRVIFLAQLINRRNEYADRAAAGDKVSFPSDDPRYELYKSISAKHAQGMVHAMDELINDFRAASRAYMKELNNNIYVNPHGWDDKTRQLGLEELQAYYDTISRVDPDGTVRREDPFAHNKFDYSSGYWSEKSLWDLLANRTRTFIKDYERPKVLNVLEAINAPRHVLNNYQRTVLRNDMYKRRAEGIPGVGNGKGLGYRLWFETPYGFGIPAVNVDGNPMNIRKGEYPDVGRTSDERAFNSYVQNRVNNYTGSYTTAGGVLNTGWDLLDDFWTLSSAGLAKQYLKMGMKGLGIAGKAALKRQLPKILLPNTFKGWAGWAGRRGLDAFNLDWLYRIGKEIDFNTENSTKHGTPTTSKAQDIHSLFPPSNILYPNGMNGQGERVSRRRIDDYSIVNKKNVQGSK